MKRSRVTRLLLMGVVPFALGACESEIDANVFANAQECANSGQLTQSQCSAAFAEAEVEHERVAPRYPNYADCIEDFGPDRCGPAHDGSSAFIPFIGGMMLGRMLDGGRYAPQPLYRPRTGDFQTAGGTSVGTRTGAIKVAESAAKPQARAITMSRAGFGSRAAARGSWGG
jgi:uncharacterized protein YgiB involved in biofilm formation